MPSEAPATSAQQPFAQPQPAPVTMSPAPAATPAPQPPTKASLKAWWKGFKQPAKGSAAETTVASPVVQPAQGIFGVPLRQSITYANVAISLVDENGQNYVYGYVPIVVAKCGVFLKEKATSVEGIFRLSGSEKRIKQLKDIFDSPDRYGKGLDWTGFTVHDAANVLRRYLNQLPEPVVPLDLYERFREPLRPFVQYSDNADEGPSYKAGFDLQSTVAKYQQLITELPPLNRQLLLYILDLLAVFASKSDENRMNAFNLSTIFQVCLIRHPAHDMEPAQHKLNLAVLIFLIENQDNFLIGMTGTEADEKTVKEVQAHTPGTLTPSTPGRSKGGLGRSASNASAGADSVRRYGGVRRNVSTTSRHSRQSNGAPSPASPAFTTPTSTSGVHRSNTVPSKKSPALSSTRLTKPSSPTTSPFGSRAVGNSALAAIASSNLEVPVSPMPTRAENAGSNVAKAMPAAIEHRHPGIETSRRPSDHRSHSRDRNAAGLFSRSPTSDAERKAPNKLRKKRVPSSSNPSAHSSTNSLNGAMASGQAGLQPASPLPEHPQREDSPTANAVAVPIDFATKGEVMEQRIPKHDDPRQSASQLKPLASPSSSYHSHSSFADHSDHEEAVAAADRAEKRSRWRLSRRREDTQSGSGIGSRKTTSDAGGTASTTSIGSSTKRKSLTGEPNHVHETPSTSQAAVPSSTIEKETTAAVSSDEKKSGPLGWFKQKIREKRDETREKEAGRERAKSPPPSHAERSSSGTFAVRGKSIDLKREKASQTTLPSPVAAAAGDTAIQVPNMAAKATAQPEATPSGPVESTPSGTAAVATVVPAASAPAPVTVAHTTIPSPAQIDLPLTTSANDPSTRVTTTAHPSEAGTT